MTEETGLELPQADHEAKLAFALLSRDNQLDLQILHDLLGAPKRFRDLKRLIKGSDTPVTRSLHRLAEHGLVRQGMTLEGDDPRYYAATGLGVTVALKTHEFRPVTEVLGELRQLGVLHA